MLNIVDRQQLWQAIHERQTATSKSADFDVFPELASRIQLDAAKFAELAAPETAHGLNERRVLASAMLAGWNAELMLLAGGSATN